MKQRRREFPPETNAAAVSLLRERLEIEKADLEAEVRVIDRLLTNLIGGTLV